MSTAINRIVRQAFVNDGVRKSGKGKGTAWFQNAYFFEDSDTKYKHFVKEGTPLYPPGTVIKELEYETDQYGGNIKKIIVGSMPKPDDGDQSGGASRPSAIDPSPAIQNRLDKDYGKSHPIWMCKRWATDLQLMRMERLYPAHTEKDGDTFPSLQKLADEIVVTAWYMFTRTKALIEGKGPVTTGSGGSEEPVQEPDLPQDDIPF